MLDGWYCRNQSKTKEEESIHEDAETNNCDSGSEEDPDEDENQQIVDYKAQYQNIKKKLKFLIYENEVFQDSLRSSQRRLLKVTRDKSFLLDRLLIFEKVSAEESSESEETESSDDDNSRMEVTKKRKSESSVGNNHSFQIKNQNPAKRKRPPPKKQGFSQVIHGNLQNVIMTENLFLGDERKFMVPEMQNVPNEIFSNCNSLDDSLDSESKLIETSPISDCLE